jgi:hypothetical protein
MANGRSALRAQSGVADRVHAGDDLPVSKGYRMDWRQNGAVVSKSLGAISYERSPVGHGALVIASQELSSTLIDEKGSGARISLPLDLTGCGAGSEPATFGL